jgi:hypothetical protein
MGLKINGVKVFSATKAVDRDRLGEVVTDWLRANKDIELESIETRLSSDNEFHCLCIVLFYIDEHVQTRAPARR